MLLKESDLFYRICDDCGDKREIKRSTYNAQKRKGDVPHYCQSCKQKGDRNALKGKNPWNKGLTKETDERVQQYGENGSKTKLSQDLTAWNKGLTKETDERVKQYSETIAISKKGKPNYKRRRQTFRDKSFKYMRYLLKKRLYILWVRPILERDEYECTICGEKRTLEVHHTKPFREIFFECLNELNLNPNEYNKWTVEELKTLEDLMIDKHSLDIGVTLCKKCHCEVDEYRKKFDKE